MISTNTPSTPVQLPFTLPATVPPAVRFRAQESSALSQGVLAPAAAADVPTDLMGPPARGTPV